VKNVSEFLQEKRQGLYEKVLENKEVAGLLMSLLANLVVLAHKRNVPIEGIDFGQPFEAMNEVRGQIRFNSLSIPSASIWGANNDFVRYSAQYGEHLWKALQKNPRIGKFFEQVVDVMDGYCQRKRIEFKDLHFKKAIITKENVLVVKLGKETLDRWGR
jgi:hypothetical protein